MNYQKISFLTAAFVVGVSLTAGAAAPGTVDINRTAGYYSGSGGEFSVTVGGASLVTGDASAYVNSYAASARVGNALQTFCLEYNEHVSIPNNYYYGTSDTAMLGGGAGDQISVGTGWLYSQFARGTLGGYDYTPGAGRAADAGDLQRAFWWLEDEGVSYDGSNPFMSAVAAFFGSGANAQLSIFGIYTAAAFGVEVLNLGNTPDGNGGQWFNQDQVVWNGGGLSVDPVPDGGLTFIMLGAALGGLALLRRKMV